LPGQPGPSEWTKPFDRAIQAVGNRCYGSHRGKTSTIEKVTSCSNALLFAFHQATWAARLAEMIFGHEVPSGKLLSLFLSHPDKYLCLTSTKTGRPFQAMKPFERTFAKSRTNVLAIRAFTWNWEPIRVQFGYGLLIHLRLYQYYNG
jgi:hypothetical protein